jgi:hypothetical protein
MNLKGSVEAIYSKMVFETVAISANDYLLRDNLQKCCNNAICIFSWSSQRRHFKTSHYSDNGATSSDFGAAFAIRNNSYVRIDYQMIIVDSGDLWDSHVLKGTDTKSV